MSKLESSEVHRNGCPLCHRTFNSNNEIADLVSEVNITVNSGFLLPVVIIVILYNLWFLIELVIAVKTRRLNSVSFITRLEPPWRHQISVLQPIASMSASWETEPLFCDLTSSFHGFHKFQENPFTHFRDFDGRFSFFFLALLLSWKTKFTLFLIEERQTKEVSRKSKNATITSFNLLRQKKWWVCMEGEFFALVNWSKFWFHLALAMRNKEV